MLLYEINLCVIQLYALLFELMASLFNILVDIIAWPINEVYGLISAIHEAVLGWFFGMLWTIFLWFVGICILISIVSSVAGWFLELFGFKKS